jgi:hypothetical protein
LRLVVDDVDKHHSAQCVTLAIHIG